MKEHQLLFNSKTKEKKKFNKRKNTSFFLSYNELGVSYMFKFNDSFFDKVEKKTKVSKDTILELASKLQNSNLKDEATLREVIQELGSMTGKEVSKEKENKIIDAVVNDKVPKDIDKMF